MLEYSLKLLQTGSLVIVQLHCLIYLTHVSVSVALNNYNEVKVQIQGFVKIC